MRTTMEEARTCWTPCLRLFIAMGNDRSELNLIDLCVSLRNRHRHVAVPDEADREPSYAGSVPQNWDAVLSNEDPRPYQKRARPVAGLQACDTTGHRSMPLRRLKRVRHRPQIQPWAIPSLPSLPAPLLGWETAKVTPAVHPRWFCIQDTGRCETIPRRDRWRLQDASHHGRSWKELTSGPRVRRPFPGRSHPQKRARRKSD